MEAVICLHATQTRDPFSPTISPELLLLIWLLLLVPVVCHHPSQENLCQHDKHKWRAVETCWPGLGSGSVVNLFWWLVKEVLHVWALISSLWGLFLFTAHQLGTLQLHKRSVSCCLTDLCDAGIFTDVSNEHAKMLKRWRLLAPLEALQPSARPPTPQSWASHQWSHKSKLNVNESGWI